ncbi:hypothetical protein Maes01_02783 [Microbulbifer aestuariivivens]|uniref:DUF2059 domain-containing protein n=1 Tax=Microbulbifer aestuariivivens TaxID=1908308 RepID=A0ABP9WSJ9_9GAMM
MKKLAVVGFGLFLSIACHAQDSKRESVQELLKATNVDSMVDTMYSQMGQAFAGIGQQLGIKAEDQPVFDAYMNKVFATMKEDMSWEKMEGPMIEIYLKHYTEKEIRDMLAFYQSESGRSMVEKMPAVMGDSMALSQQMVQSFLPKVQAMAEELKTDLQKHRNSQ